MTSEPNKPRKRKPGGGRKPKPAGELRDQRLPIYVTRATLAAIQARGGAKWAAEELTKIVAGDESL